MGEPKTKAKVITKGIQFIVFGALLVTAYVFVKDTLQDYWEKKKGFSQSKEALTGNDLPTMTLCFEGKIGHKLAYGKDIIISTWFDEIAFLNNESMNTLQVGLNKVRDLSIHLKELVSVSWLRGHTKDCIAMSVNMTNDEEISGEVFHLGMFQISLIKRSESEQIKDPILYVTSEKNLYGAAIGRWYDGIVNPYELTRLENEYHYLTITETRRLEYLKETCSQKSFYECLSSKLEACQACYENGKPCSPGYSLPSMKDSFTDIEVCETTRHYNHSKEYTAFDTECRGQKSCSIQEYSVKLLATKELQLTGQGEDYHFVASLVAGDDIFSSNGERTSNLHVNVHTEYLISSDISLIGTIGGQMGLFVGFSFQGFIDWASKLFIKWCHKAVEKYLV